MTQIMFFALIPTKMLDNSDVSAKDQVLEGRTQTNIQINS